MGDHLGGLDLLISGFANLGPAFGRGLFLAQPEFREVVDDSDRGQRQPTATGAGGGVR